MCLRAVCAFKCEQWVRGTCEGTNIGPPQWVYQVQHPGGINYEQCGRWCADANQFLVDVGQGGVDGAVGCCSFRRMSSSRAREDDTVLGPYTNCQAYEESSIRRDIEGDYVCSAETTHAARPMGYGYGSSESDHDDEPFGLNLKTKSGAHRQPGDKITCCGVS